MAVSLLQIAASKLNTNFKKVLPFLPRSLSTNGCRHQRQKVTKLDLFLFSMHACTLQWRSRSSCFFFLSLSVSPDDPMEMTAFASINCMGAVNGASNTSWCLVHSIAGTSSWMATHTAPSLHCRDRWSEKKRSCATAASSSSFFLNWFLLCNQLTGWMILTSHKCLGRGYEQQQQSSHGQSD